jgi:hypothetical protein
MVDVEADGPIPGDYSMISFGTVLVDEKLDKTFFGQLKPISERYIPEALEVSGYSRAETLTFKDPFSVMTSFHAWVQDNTKANPMFISDNNGFDWMFMCWYLWHFLGTNVFGHSSTNLGSLYKGAEKNFFKNFKHLRKTRHTHDPVQDSIGNAEAFLEIIKIYHLKINL